MTLEGAVEIFDYIIAFEGRQLQPASAILVQVCHDVVGRKMASVLAVYAGEAGIWLEGLIHC